MAEQEKTNAATTANREIPSGFVVELFHAQRRPVTVAELAAFDEWRKRCGVVS